ncbi:MAG: DUF998 domain-containing protein [Candidatus Hermodarchaeia archaeon]|jgi:hypothetical membrane protein
MVKVQSKWNLLVLPGVIGAILYCSLTYVSILHYYLSRLGNSSLNPTGAIYYNLAVIQTGVMLLLTYLGIFSAYKNTKHYRLLIIATVIGMFNAFSIVMSGVFSEDIYQLHFIFSLLIFATWVPVLFSMNYILFKQGGYEKGISYYGFVVGVLNTIFVLFVLLFGTDSGAIIEWISIFSFLTWALLVVLFIIWRFRTQPK